MAHSYPDGYIPLGDAFTQALAALGNCDSITRPIEASKIDDTPDDLVNESNARKRSVERLMRDAIADGKLPVFKKAPNGQVERLVEREAWRQPAFGVPGL
jgi:hypothetical protein